VNPKDEAEQVMNAGIPFAQKMLAAHGEFYPFGFAMTADGKVAAVAAASADEHPASQQVIDNLMSAFRSGAAAGHYKVTAVFFVAPNQLTLCRLVSSTCQATAPTSSFRTRETPRAK
jgi:hypothetical protein